MPGSITVGLDGTGQSLAAADWAADEALARDVPLQLVQVRETGAYPSSPIVDEDQLERERAQRITGEVNEHLARRHTGLRITVMTPAGRPAHVLSELSGGTDLLVLGSRGLSRAVGYVLGSTALSTVAHAECPVVLIRAPAEKDRDGEPTDSAPPVVPPDGDIVLGIDLVRPCDELIDFALRAAVLHSRRLRILHGWHPPPALGATPSYPVGMDLADQLQEGADRRLAEALRPWLEKFPEVEVVRSAPLGRAQDVLLDAAADASLVVVGRRVRRARAGTHIGPVAHAVMHHVCRPVVVVPHR